MDPLQTSFMSNKQLKEDFVSNLTGSTMLEVISLSTIVPAFILLRRSICFNGLCGSNTIKATSKKSDFATDCKTWNDFMSNLAMDFVFSILPILLFLTVLGEWVHICVICLIVLLPLCIREKRFDSSYSKGEQELANSIRSNVSAYRVSMMIVTCLCILAVDFRIFPRRYAKTETYGTSLMDLGVGSFVLANSLVSRQARNVTSTPLLVDVAVNSTSMLVYFELNKWVRHTGAGVSQENIYTVRVRKWMAALQSTSPLIILGIGRIIFTAGVDYQALILPETVIRGLRPCMAYPSPKVHVGEYGVHWNFFFTLAAVSILTSIINIHPQYSGILGSTILIGYQICLMSGLNEFLLSNERSTDIISQNKEGIFSIFGYWGMYLVGVQLGNYLFFRNDSTAKMRNNQWTRTRIWFLAVLFWSLTFILDKHVERVSRRMCNLAYVSFVLAQNCQVLAILMLSDFVRGQKTSVLEEAFNQNLLGIFLLANVLTGLINMYFNTLSASSITALIILVGYALILSVLAGLAKFSGIKLKFW